MPWKKPEKLEGLGSENLKTLMEEIQEDLADGNTPPPPCLWIRRINIVKMTLLPRAVYSFNALPIKGPMDIQKTPTLLEGLSHVIL